MFSKKKKGQISETMTWIVATLIIVVILSISVFLASLVGQDKKFPTTERIDLFAKKSLTSYLLTRDNSGTSMYDEINNAGNLTNTSGNLALKIFTGLYSGDYKTIWFVVYSRPHNIIHNTFFPRPPPCGTGISYEIQLRDSKYLLLTLTKEC